MVDRNIISANDGMQDKLDAVDWKILKELTENARIPVAELARKVGLSKTPSRCASGIWRKSA